MDEIIKSIMIKIATDFSGVGSPETALKRLGIEHEVVFACDIDKYARNSYQALHKPQQMFEDITTRPMDFPQLDLYVAGFPCQSFSQAGKRRGFGCPTNGTLFHTLSEFIRINQPKTFILENVKGLINHDNGRTFQIIKDKLSGSGGSVNEQMFLTDIDGLGYHIYLKVLNTKHFGLPQNRERIFIVGFKEPRKFSFPITEPLTMTLKDILQDNPNSKYLVSKDSVQYLQENQKFNKFEPLNSESEFVGCITARSNKISADNNFIEVDEKYYLSDKMTEKFTLNGKESGIIGDLNKGGQKGVVFSKDSKTMSCLTATDYKQPKQIIVDEKYYLSDKMIKGFQNHKERHIEKGTGFTWTPKNGDDIANCLRANASLCPTDNSIIVHSTHTRSSDRPSVQKNKNAGGSGHLSKSDGLTYCIDTQNSQAVEFSKRIRRLTPLECFRLQGFTDEEHSICEQVQSDSQLYKQMGNTISVPVIQAILKNIYNA
tara:strand:+ start:1167 stop:2627 length:1461 start_codon:yes stop_codon:yes gene_type:complete